MPSLPVLKALPWSRVVWLAQIVASGIRELEQKERKEAREIFHKLARDRRLSKKDRDHLASLAKKVGKGAAKGARPGRGFKR
jgi:hypothetical protein